MGQVGEQNVTLLSQEAVFAACFQPQTAFVVAKLLYFGPATVIVCRLPGKISDQTVSRYLTALTRAS